MTDGGVVDINSKKPHVAVMVLCLCCNHRWLDVLPIKTNFFQLPCGQCRERKSWVTWIPTWYLELTQ